MPRVREDLEATPVNRLVCRVGVFHWNEWIAIPPDDQCGKLRRKVKSIECGRALAPDVDDRAHGVDERLPGVRFQGHVAAPQLAQVSARAQTDATEQAPGAADDAAQARGAKQQEDPF